MANKIALVTGGSRGVGKEMALRLAEYGLDVILTYRQKKAEAEEVIRAIEKMDSRAKALALDMEEEDAWEGFADSLQKLLLAQWKENGFDFLIHNAGMCATVLFEQVTTELFNRFMNVHYKGPYFLTQYLLHLLRAGGGIVTISSGATPYAFPGYLVYASMNGAVETLTKQFAKELGAKGICANTVAPGPIETDFKNAAIRNNQELKYRLRGRSPLGRVGRAIDLGGVVAFLCSPDAAWINGQRIEVSGGINFQQVGNIFQLKQ